MISLKKKNEQGFTIVELLIVIVVIGILAAIVITTYGGIQSKARNAKRETDIQSLQTQIEAFFSQNQYYPSLADMNSSAWLTANMKSLDTNSLKDPSWTSGLSCGTTGPQFLQSGTTVGCYVYNVSNSGTTGCADPTCNEYTLSANLEQGAGTYSKQNLD